MTAEGNRARRDDSDLKLAADELAAGRELLREAHLADDREAIKVALGKLALASRSVDLVVERRGGICGDALDTHEGATKP